MSNLDNLTAKLLSDSNERAVAVIKEAEDRAAAIVQEYTTAAGEKKELILAEGAKEAGKVLEQMLLAKKLEIRDKNLNAKQEVINRVFSIALERLNNMSREEYFRFLSGCLKSMDLDGEKIVIPKKYQIASIEEFNACLQDDGMIGKLTLSNDGNIEGGYILIKDGIQNNNTFEAMVNFCRYELESKIIEALF